MLTDNSAIRRATKICRGQGVPLLNEGTFNFCHGSGLFKGCLERSAPPEKFENYMPQIG